MEENSKKRILEDMFLRDKPSKIMLDLNNAKGSIYATILSKDSNCTYSHTIKILNLFKKMGIVTFEKKGRIKVVKLTDAGWEIAHNLDAVARKLDEIEDRMEKNEDEKADKRKAKASRKKSED
jgi:predicted transcriptional regulator